MTEGVDRKTGAPTTRRDSAIFAFKSAKGVWGKTRVFPHSFFKIICCFDFIDSLWGKRRFPLFYKIISRGLR